MYPNPLKQKIRDGKLVLGTMLPTHDIRIPRWRVKTS
jgi:hypothetical protein